jgi:recombination protein RecT
VTDTLQQRMATAGARTDRPGTDVSIAQQRRTDVVNMQSQFALALGDPKLGERFTRVALTALSRPPAYPGASSLAECTRESLLGGLITCAQLRLEPNDPRGLAYLIPFRNNRQGTVEAQLVIGYRGLIDLAYRSGQVKTLAAETVHEHDTFVVRRWPRELSHTEPLDRDRGKVTGYYAAVEYISGGTDYVFMSKAEVEAWRDRYSKSAKQKDSPWQNNFDEMAKKTCLRRLTKLMPLSVEDMRQMAAGLAVDGSVQTNLAALSLDAIIASRPLELEHTDESPPRVDETTGEIRQPADETGGADPDADADWPPVATPPDAQ